MSRRSNRNRNTITLDRRDLERIVDAAIERKYTPPSGATVTPLNQNVINQMMASLAPQAKTQGMFAPGAPLTPNAQITPAQGPRQWQYPVGYNIGQLPRSTETTSFDTLRNLASLYDGIGICQRKWFDLCSKPKLQIKPRDELTKDKNGKPIPQIELDAKYGARIEKWKAFFKKPDRKKTLKQWMRKGLKDVLEIDALSIFKHKDRAGRLYALEIIDGATIKPLLDERGMEPEKPYPAYQQFVYGVPGMQLLADQLIYRRETERTDSPYGLSRVEIIILRVNQALRKQNKDLSTFTDGNVPNSTLEPPVDGTDWTPEQLLTYQTMWDGMLAGNEAIKARLKVIPPGAKLTKLDPDDIQTPFDTFLLNVTVGAYGLTMSELGFTENVNKSSGETQEAIIYRYAMSQTMGMFGEIFTDVMAEEDGNDDLIATWEAFEEPEDFKTKAEAEDILVKNGTMSTSQGSRWLGIEPPFETEPFITVPGQGIVFIKDANDPKMRQAANDAKLAGYEQAQQPPEQQSGQGNQAEGNDEDDQQAIDEADKMFGGPQRFDPVHGFHGEFGAYSSGASKSTSGHHKGMHHKKSGKHRPRMSASQRMAHLAARFAKMQGGKQLSSIFSQIGAAIAKGGQQQAIDGLLDKAWSAAKTLFANKPKSLAAMSRTLTALDNRNDKGKLRAVEAEEDDDEAFDEEAFDELEDILDDEQGSQPGAQDAQGAMGGEQGQGGATTPGDADSAGEHAQDGSGDDAGAEKRSVRSIVPGQSEDAERAISAEYRRWRECAIKDVKAGKPVRNFTSDIMAEELMTPIRQALERCQTVDDVRAVFRAKQLLDAETLGGEPRLEYNPALDIWEPADTESQLAALRSQGDIIEWENHGSQSGVCDICGVNDGARRTIGEQFPSGHRLPQCHNGCQCTVKVVKK